MITSNCSSLYFSFLLSYNNPLTDGKGGTWILYLFPEALVENCKQISYASDSDFSISVKNYLKQKI